MRVRNGLLAGMALVGSAVLASASAATLSYLDLPNSGSTATVNGFNVSTLGGDFERKSLNGVAGVGVSGGTVGGEIDGNETITFSGATLANKLNGFTVSFLYQNANMNDSGNEVALLDVNGTVLTTITLTASGGDGTVSVGTVKNLSPSTDGGGGEFQVSNLDFAFSSLVFRSGNSSTTSAQAGDFAFVSLDYTAVPEPMSLALLGTALAGAGLLRRRAG